MWWFIWAVMAITVLLYTYISKWWDKRRHRQRKSMTEELADIEHDIEMIKMAVTLEFLPILEDIMESLTDLLREYERRGRQ